MVESKEVQEQDVAVAAFGARVENLRREGAWDHELGEPVPWAEAPEPLKLRAIIGEALSVSVSIPTVSGAETLAAVERNVAYGGLPAWQQEMLRDVRQRIDDGQLALIPMEGKPANKSTCNRSKFFVKSGCSPICFVIGYQEP
jgi:hypothetical protein